MDLLHLIMLITWRRITEPTQEPVTLDQAKQHLYVDHNLDDDLINFYIQTARAVFEEDTARAFCTQQWSATLAAWPQRLELPRATPLVSVDAIAYTAPDGANHTLDLTHLIIDPTEPALIDFSAISLPPIRTNSRITITYTCGQPPENLPPLIKHAILLLVAHYYANREAVQMENVQALAVPETIQRLQHLLRIPR